MSSKTCKKCGEEYRKIDIQPITKYCARCDKVYNFMPADADYLVDMLQKALARRRGPTDKGFHQISQAMINALEGNATMLKGLAGEES
jgi:hypothetical protein